MTEGRLEATADRIMQFDTRANMIKDVRIITIRKMEEICSFFGIWLRSYVSIKQLDQCFHRYAKCDAPFLYGESKKKAMKVTNVYATVIYIPPSRAAGAILDAVCRRQPMDWFSHLLWVLEVILSTVLTSLIV